MYVRRVIFKKLAGTEIDFFVFLLSTRSSSIKSLSVENNMVMAIWYLPVCTSTNRSDN